MHICCYLLYVVLFLLGPSETFSLPIQDMNAYTSTPRAYLRHDILGCCTVREGETLFSNFIFRVRRWIDPV